jgi:hypothetical protein
MSEASKLALKVARESRPHMAEGGHKKHKPHLPEVVMPDKVHVGPIHSAVDGRTDHLPVHVPDGSYVLPADIVSGLGEGNTLAGFKHLNVMYDELLKANRHYGGNPYGGAGMPYGASSSGPYGSSGMPYGAASSGPYGAQLGRAEGGKTEMKEPVPCVLAGGESVLTPQQVAHWGDGDADAGYKALDEFVLRYRKKTINTLKNLPGPRHD